MIEILAQYTDLGFFILRVAVAIIFIYHGWMKLAQAKSMATMMGMPAGMIWTHGLIEVLASLGLILGILTQVSAIVLAVIMVGAIYFKIAKWNTPFAPMDKAGWEFDFVLLAANLAIILSGGGAIAIL